MKKILIIGISSTAIHALAFITSYKLYEVIGFAVDKEYRTMDHLKGLPVYNLDDIDSVFDKKNDVVFVALFWNRLNADRRKIYQTLKERAIKFANLISPTAIIRGEIRGDNCWIHDYVVIQNDAIVNSNVMVMAHAFIGSSTIISSHCFLGTKAVVAGECSVGIQTFLGINSTIFDGRKVGEKCIVGACTAVKRDLPDFTIIKTKAENYAISQRLESEIESKLLFKKNIK